MQKNKKQENERKTKPSYIVIKSGESSWYYGHYIIWPLGVFL